MVVAALVISIVALSGCGLLALAVLELVAERPAGANEPSEDSFEEMELAPRVEGTLASSHGLPAPIDQSPTHLVLVVSPMCAKCQRLAGSFDGSIPEQLTVMVTASDPTRMRKWVTISGLDIDEVVLDDDMAIANSLGVESSPAVIGFVGGQAAFAGNIGGRSALDRLLAQQESIREDTPDPARRTPPASLQPPADAARAAEPPADD